MGNFGIKLLQIHEINQQGNDISSFDIDLQNVTFAEVLTDSVQSWTYAIMLPNGARIQIYSMLSVHDVLGFFFIC